MPRVIFVKKARKDNPAVKKGESYYWWKPFRSGKRYSATRPKPSQLCSGKKAEVMAAQEELDERLNNMTLNTASLDFASAFEEASELCGEIAESLRDLGQEYEDSVDNMPESLQWGEQAENMREMAESIINAADELENYIDWQVPEASIDTDNEPELDDFDDYDEYMDALNEWQDDRDDWINECKQEFEDNVTNAIEAAAQIEFYF